MKKGNYMFYAMRRLVMPLTFVFLTAGQRAGAGPVLEFSTGTVAVFTGGDTSGGWSFTTNQAITVVALDAYEPNSGNDVRLYDGNGTVLASAIVLPTDPTGGSPIPFYTHAITPVTLAAGQTYYIAEDFPANINQFYYNTDTPVTDPAITYGAGVFSTAGLGQDPTTDAFGGRPPAVARAKAYCQRGRPSWRTASSRRMASGSVPWTKPNTPLSIQSGSGLCALPGSAR